jgi:chromosome segregation ATPase
MNKSSCLVASLAAMLMFACASEKEPAQQAIANLDSTLSAIHDSAAKNAPETLQTVEAQVAALKGKLSQGDYKGVLADAAAVKSALSALRQDVDAKQSAIDAEMAKTKQLWRNLNSEVPKLVAAIHAQVDALTQSKKFPKGVTKASFETVKTDATALDTTWTEATNAVANQDDYVTAVAKAQQVKDKATQMMQTLGIKPS